MPDREKVIRGLECCTETDDCNSCPYFEKPEYCSEDVLMRDALALLKEQEAVEPKLYTPTTPTFWKSWYTCGVCEWPVREKTEWGSGDKFCPKCGRRIKWPKKEEDENV